MNPIGSTPAPIRHTPASSAPMSGVDQGTGATPQATKRPGSTMHPTAELQKKRQKPGVTQQNAAPSPPSGRKIAQPFSPKARLQARMHAAKPTSDAGGAAKAAGQPPAPAASAPATPTPPAPTPTKTETAEVQPQTIDATPTHKPVSDSGSAASTEKPETTAAPVHTAAPAKAEAAEIQAQTVHATSTHATANTHASGQTLAASGMPSIQEIDHAADQAIVMQQALARATQKMAIAELLNSFAQKIIEMLKKAVQS
jgi:hypothetical protein